MGLSDNNDLSPILSLPLPSPSGILSIRDEEIVPHHRQWHSCEVPQCVGVEYASQWRKVYQLERGGGGRQCNYYCGCASIRRSVASGHHREAREGPTTGPSK
jgi:hypothetical protein